MSTIRVNLYEAEDSDGAYAIRLAGAETEIWRAQKGYGSKFTLVWTVEFEIPGSAADPETLDWNEILDRSIEAYSLSDPIVTTMPRMV
jgi:hypothetical protein